MGYWLGEEFWARGIMTEAVGAFTDFCFDRFSLRRIYAEPFANNPASARVWKSRLHFRRASQEQRDATRAGKSRFHFRRAPQEQRDEGWTSSRFIALRPNKVAPCEPATCVSIDHRRYGSPQQTNDFIYRSRLQRRARTFGYSGCDSGGRVWRDTAVRDHRR